MDKGFVKCEYDQATSTITITLSKNIYEIDLNNIRPICDKVIYKQPAVESSKKKLIFPTTEDINHDKGVYDGRRTDDVS